ncbi:MAG: M48 family metalloprotease, partial [Saprospiraceae bacterium]|nr:M48 family metalloprotease [Saprospiraceae bacterium]
MNVRLLLVAFGAIFILFSIVGCRKNIGEQFGSNSSEFTAEEQATLGSAILANMESRPDRFPFLDKDQNWEAYSYLQDSLLEPLVYGSPLQYRLDFDWQVHIIQDDAVDNAFALPGGHVVIYTGLLKYLEGNDEASSVLAHEIAYTDNEIII